MLRNARFVTHISECPVAIVVEQPTGHRIVDPRNAVVTFARFRIPAKFIFLLREIHEPADEQIEPTIIVVIEPDCTGTPAGGAHTRLLGDVRKRAIAVVVIQDAAAILGYIKIGEAVPVIITNGDSHAVTSAAHAGLFGDLREGSVAIIVIEGIPKRRIWREEITTAAIDEIDIHPAVVVVVEKSAAGAGRLGKVVIGRPSVVMLPGDSAYRGRHDLEEWPRRILGH